MTTLFSSKRERRLWTGVLAVVVTIYSSLGLAAKLVGQINESILAGAFFACFVLVGVMILSQGLRVRPGGIEIGVATGIAVVYMLLGVRMAIPERSHLMEYGILAILVYEAINERVTNGRHLPFPAVCAFIATSLVGVVDESIQVFLPVRVFDWRDIAFNILASLTAVVGMMAIRWAQSLTKRLRQRTWVDTNQLDEPVRD